MTLVTFSVPYLKVFESVSYIEGVKKRFYKYKKVRIFKPEQDISGFCYDLTQISSFLLLMGVFDNEFAKPCSKSNQHWTLDLIFQNVKPPL